MRRLSSLSSKNFYCHRHLGPLPKIVPTITIVMYIYNVPVELPVNVENKIPIYIVINRKKTTSKDRMTNYRIKFQPSAVLRAVAYKIVLLNKC